MKSIMLALVFSLVVCFSTLVGATDKYYWDANPDHCKMCELVANSTKRMVVDLDTNKIIGLLPLVGEPGNWVVLAERIGGCGWIEQDIDENKDNIADLTLIWAPVVIPASSLICFALYDSFAIGTGI